MSIFSSLKKSRQQAKEHNAKLAELKKKETEKIPYKHVPTHAATDAFTSAPPSWREADRPRIVEQNRRRSAMAASGHHMNMPGVPRLGSTLSRVSYPGENATPVIHLPRAYSYSGGSSCAVSARQSREIIYTPSEPAAHMPMSVKGKEVPRAYDSHRVSPASSKGVPSPMDSSDGFTSSQDDLEMKPSKPKAKPAEDTGTHHLHPRHARRKSDASIKSKSSTARSTHGSHSRDARPPPSMRAYGSIPAVAVMSPTNMGGVPGYFSSRGPAGPSSSSTPSPLNTLTPNSLQGSVTSLYGLPQGHAIQTSSPPITSHASTVEKHDQGLGWISFPQSDMDNLVHSVTAGAEERVSSAYVATASIHQTASRHKQHGEIDRNQEPDQFRQEKLSSQVVAPHQHQDQSRAPTAGAKDYLVNVFPEEVMPELSQAKPSKNKKLSKGASGKMHKKNRWSISKASPVAV